jgi:hypothetical protein
MTEHNTTIKMLKLLGQEFMFDIVRRAFGLPTSGGVIVLCGPAGSGKSRSIRALAWNGKADILNAKGMQGNEIFSGVSFVEIADFTNLTPKHYKKLEQIITNPKNAKITFIGTSNTIPNPNVNRDDKHFIYIEVGQIDVAAIERDRDQLFGEAVSKLRAKGELPPE